MKKQKKPGFIEYGLLGWFFALCLMIVLAVTSEIKAKPVYLNDTANSMPFVTGIEIEIADKTV